MRKSLVKGLLLGLVIGGVALFSGKQVVAADKQAPSKYYLSELVNTYENLNNGSVTVTRDSQSSSALKNGSNLGTSVDDKNGYFKLTKKDDSDFKVMQITDWHLSGASTDYRDDVRQTNAVYNLIKADRPDLLVLTGDLIFGGEGRTKADNRKCLDTLLCTMDRIGIPWIWVFGNHDHEAFDDVYTVSQFENQISYSKTLLMYGDDKTVSRYTNGAFNLYNKDGSLNSTVITVDTGGNDYDRYGYDYILDDQVEWYKNTLGDIAKSEDIKVNELNSYLYIHIPFKEYRTLWDVRGTSLVTYHEGDKREEVCSSTHDSKMFDAIIELGSTKTVSCGHDHINDYWITYHGKISDVDIIYGMSIEYLVYAGEETAQRGSTLNVISQKDGSHYISRTPLVCVLDNGWAVTPEGHRFYYVNGTKVVGLKCIDGKYYYFNAAGQVIRDAVEEGGEFFIDGQKYINSGWHNEDGVDFWYEDNEKQGTTGRGKEIYDPESNAWYWLDAVQGGAVAKSKDVYQESAAGKWAENADGTGKWVRYDENGHMLKGWVVTEEGTYYFDTVYGTMAKGNVVIDDKNYSFDKQTGKLYKHLEWVVVDGKQFWYEHGEIQGTIGRGKEIYDPQSDAWYWLDAVQGGAVAKDKDVYQESEAGEWADNEDGTGKWVRYDSEGHMIKGWNTDYRGTYYFDEIFGTMAKGDVEIDGVEYYFDEVTGILK